VTAPLGRWPEPVSGSATVRGGRRCSAARPASLLRPGQLVVADAGNALVRLVAAPSQRSLRPPTSPALHPQFDADAFGRVPLLWPVAPFTGPHEVAGSFGEVRGRAGPGRRRRLGHRADTSGRLHSSRLGGRCQRQRGTARSAGHHPGPWRDVRRRATASHSRDGPIADNRGLRCRAAGRVWHTP